MINKTIDSPAAAVADIFHGATVMIGGFGEAGSPIELIHALIDPIIAYTTKTKFHDITLVIACCWREVEPFSVKLYNCYRNLLISTFPWSVRTQFSITVTSVSAEIRRIWTFSSPHQLSSICTSRSQQGQYTYRHSAMSRVRQIALYVWIRLERNNCCYTTVWSARTKSWTYIQMLESFDRTRKCGVYIKCSQGQGLGKRSGVSDTASLLIHVGVCPTVVSFNLVIALSDLMNTLFASDAWIAISSDAKSLLLFIWVSETETTQNRPHSVT